VKWLIINTEAFSPRGGKQKKLSLADLPWVVSRFLSAFPKLFLMLDESSKIRCNTPLMEHKKSTRTQLIKMLGRQAAEKCIMTATLASKSPVNMYDQFDFLCEGYFPESIYEFAERYCIMETLRYSKGRRVLITKDDYSSVRGQLTRAWRHGGKRALNMTKEHIFTDYAIPYDKQDHIMEHREYSPFINKAELFDRIAPVTMRVKRSDIFDITHDRFVKHPIMRPAELSGKARQVVNELVKIGFTDNYTLGKAPALDLLLRVQDVCNGFEPVETEPGPVDYFDPRDKPERKIAHRPFDENPKLEALMALLEEIDTGENQVVVWSSRKLLIRACAERFTKEEIPFVVYDGSAGDIEKMEAERDFVSGEARIFLANQASGAYGLNCLAKCSYAVYICLNDSVEQYYQSQHRILRGELQAPKFAYHIYMKGTVEERQLVSLALGRGLIEEENKPELFLCS
jgi:hypothetical protein